jgi:hypothetical protein
MSLNIPILTNESRILRFQLFDNTADLTKSFNLNHLYSEHGTLDVDVSLNSLSIVNNNSVDEEIQIKFSDELYIRRYETLSIDYNFTSFSGVEIKLYEFINGQLENITIPNLLQLTNNPSHNVQGYTDEIFASYFTEYKQIIIGINISKDNGFINIKRFDVYAHEGDKMIYNDEAVIQSFSSIEYNIYNNIVNMNALGPSGLDISGINTLYYKDISGLLTSSSGLLYKEFPNIDHPRYDTLTSYTNSLVDYSKQVQNNINLQVPQGYIYLLQFILNDITFTSYPSIELTGIYGDFYNENYYSSGNTYDLITASGSTYATNISGKNIKLHIPSINDNVIDPRNSRNFILKKINIMFMKFHNAVFDFSYNYVDFSGNYIGDSPFVQTLFAPTINNDGSNSKIVFEFIRKHTILHYHSVIINDLLARFVDKNDLQNYYRVEETNCSNSEVIINQLSIEFLELMRLLCNLDQNQNQLYVINTDGIGPSGYNTYDIYNSNNYVNYDNSGYTVSGIHWGKFFKCSNLTPNYSQKISPIIHYSDIYGNSITSQTTSGIIENNAYFYFANKRLETNKISSGQQIRSSVTDYDNKKLCPIDPTLFNSYDVSGLLLSHDLLEYTPFIPYILYESDALAQGTNLAPNSVGSNIFLKNIFNAIYKSRTDFTDLYINSKTILFDFINNGLDTSGNIIAGRIDDDNIIKTVDAIYIRDVIRATHTKYTDDSVAVVSAIANPITYTGYNQQYYIFSVSPIFDPNVKKYIVNVSTTQIFYYVGEEDYLKFKPFSKKLFSSYNNYNYYLDDVKITPATAGSLGDTFYLILKKPSTTPDLPNRKLNLLFFSVIADVNNLNL